MTPPHFKQALHQLIATPSMSCVNPAFDTSNRAVIDLLAQWYRDAGFQVEVLPLPEQPHKANLIATLGGGPGGLVLSGHTDTVPYDEGRWQYDPLRLTEADNRFYGLGTADMKGFFALVLEALRELDPAKLKAPLIVLATADEESSMEGAKAIVELGRPRARYAVIGEPTGLRPIHAHKGIMMEAIHVQGCSGHSSNPALGRNALEGMHKVIAELLRFRDELQKHYRDSRFDVPLPTLNLGHIKGGDNPNRICAACELQIDVRLLPGMDMDQIRTQLNQRLSPLLRDEDMQVTLRPLIEGTPPFETPADSDVVREVARLTGYTAQTAAFCTEAPYLNALGMESVLLGPGDIDQAHQPDEFLGLERIHPYVDTLKALIKRYCLSAG